jgi:hypothetical protein
MAPIVATIVAKKPRSEAEGCVFEVMNHADQLGAIAGTPDWSWRDWSWQVWVHGTEKAIRTKYTVVFAVTKNSEHDRLNSRDDLSLSKTQKPKDRFDMVLRTLFGIPRNLEFVKAQVLISPIPRYRRVVLTIKSMRWKIERKRKAMGAAGRGLLREPAAEQEQRYSGRGRKSPGSKQGATS